MLLSDLNKISEDKLLLIHEDILSLYKNFLADLEVKEGDYIKKIYNPSDIEEHGNFIFKIKSIELIENNSLRSTFGVPKICVNAIKCFSDGKETKSCYNINLDEFIKHDIGEKPVKKIKSTTYVYLISCGDMYKIGFSNKPKSRLAQIQCHNPLKCEILYLIEDRFGTLEKELHTEFAKYRRQGEWFDSHNDILTKFKSLKSQFNS